VISSFQSTGGACQHFRLLLFFVGVVEQGDLVSVVVFDSGF
jgi:hypothetical protein